MYTKGSGGYVGEGPNPAYNEEKDRTTDVSVSFLHHLEYTAASFGIQQPLAGDIHVTMYRWGDYAVTITVCVFTEHLLYLSFTIGVELQHLDGGDMDHLLNRLRFHPQK